ncbi:MATE family efflux transporter [Clostridium sp. B9]|uniref:MATE family efflux transporter n=1 Tax=Clostridium sp. B9 TaxID=3423224 RepID=UPI003D2EEFB1
MNSREERTRLMAEGDMGSVLWKFAIPAIASALISAIYNIVDTMFVGLLNDTSALGAVSVAFPVFLLINSVGQMYGVGAASYIARLLGGDEKDNADKVASTITWVAFGTGLFLTVLVMIFLSPILRVLGATDTILPLAIEYSIPLVLGSVFAILMPTLANIIRSEGNTKFSAIAIGAGGVANIILDPIFIFSLDMGVKGAAVATALSQVLTVVILILYFVMKKNYIEIKLKKFAPSIKMFREVLTVGTATII